MLSIEGIQNGFILDHIPAGKGLELYQLLELEDSSASVALLQNVRSGKCGRKDLIKIEGTELPKRIEILGKVDPNITVNIVQHGEVVKKYHPVPPQRLVNVVRCKNLPLKVAVTRFFVWANPANTIVPTVGRRCSFVLIHILKDASYFYCFTTINFAKLS